MWSVCFCKSIKGKKAGGYFTVEASMLFPMIFVIQLFIICLSVYMYDRCVMEQCAYEAAFRGSSNMLHGNEEAQQSAKEAAENLIADRLFAVSELESTVTASATEICVVYEGKISMPFMSWSAPIKAERKIPRSNPLRAIRIQEFGKELLKNGNQ